VYDIHRGEDTSSGGWNETSTVDNDYEEPDIGGYHHHHMYAMVSDALRYGKSNVVDGPNVNATSFYNLLQATQQPLYEGCSNYSELSAATRLLSIKSVHNTLNRYFDDVLHLMQDTTPTPNCIAYNFNVVKKKVKELRLDYKNIHCCRNGCMLYYKQDEHLTSCKFCGFDRFKGGNGCGKNSPVTKMHYMPLIPRLQRLYASKTSAAHMVWHKYHAIQTGQLTHPSDAEAWKHFDRTFESFVVKLRNVRLGLCADGFNPYSNVAKPYSVWPIMICVYNLLPHLCMTSRICFFHL